MKIFELQQVYYYYYFKKKKKKNNRQNSKILHQSIHFYHQRIN